jgi:FKBP-type peptidyl-prolyl cis-trans isomerase FklB
MTLFEKLQAAKAAKIATIKAEGEMFLQQNVLQADVVVLESGLQYKVINAAINAQQPTINNTITCYYHGTLINGTVFDTTTINNKPATFTLQKLIKGWQIGLPLMSVGSKYIFYIPSHLAYGDEQTSPKIPPSSTLIIEVELLGIA